MRGTTWGLIIGGLLLSSPAEGQRNLGNRGGTGGSCQLRGGFECVYDAESEERADGEVEWLRLVVLWRVPPELRNHRMRGDTVLQSVVANAFRSASRAAEDRGRSFSGGSNGRYWYGVEKTRAFPFTAQQEEIRIADETITLPTGDSLLVVLVDGVHSPAGAAPRVVQRLRRPSEPHVTGRKRWRNGDTTFFIDPRLGDDDWMGRILRDVPEVRAFMDRAATDTTARRAP